MTAILICDDDKDIVTALEIYLHAEGFDTVAAYNGRQALELLQANDIQLVLMDVMMPQLDGISATAKIRELSPVPVILLTAKSEDIDKVLGLNIGADDYVTKPFNPVELIARIKAQLRRYLHYSAPMAVAPSELAVGGLLLDVESKSLTLDGEPISLTPTEFDILRLLMEQPGKVFSTAEIYQRVWGGQSFGADSTVAVHIRHLREKIEINPSEPRYLKVVWGQGYKMEKGDKK